VFPFSASTTKFFGLLAKAIAVDSNQTFAAKGPPVARWQSRQWHWNANIGGIEHT
jgi:hypothetical protein